MSFIGFHMSSRRAVSRRWRSIFLHFLFLIQSWSRRYSNLPYAHHRAYFYNKTKIWVALSRWTVLCRFLFLHTPLITFFSFLKHLHRVILLPSRGAYLPTHADAISPPRHLEAPSKSVSTIYIPLSKSNASYTVILLCSLCVVVDIPAEFLLVASRK